MASSSSSSLASRHHHQISYDVFISFRGPDVRRGFLSHLVEAFKERGIDAYVDDRIVRGEEISVALPEAIEKSQISLIIFSKNYASSKWCLEELVKIIECREQNNQIVIPVFYDIEPSHVRNQIGDYGIPFAEHETKYGISKVTKWKTASKKAATLSGLNLSNFRSEAEFVEEIIQCVLEKLDDKVYQRDLENLVGIERQVTEVELLLCNRSKDVCIVGLWSMGGIGKTTIANALFSKLYCQYKGCCFKVNMREELDKHTIADLKTKLFSKLLKEKDPHMAMILEEPYRFIRRLQRKKALVLFDDVTELDNLKFLINEGEVFGSGSIIIVTSRNKQILNHIAGDLIYEVKALNYNEAMKLFSLNAFKQEHPNKNWIELSARVMQYAEGNPLALKVLGSLLLDAEPREWESLLERPGKMPCEGIQQVLRLSYDSLEPEHQQMFLYIACYFRSESEESIRILLDGCGFLTSFGFRSLQNKALILITNGYVWMHDLIQEMGRKIVHEESLNEPGKCKHLWNADDICQVLMNNTGIKAIQSIILHTNEIKELHLRPRVLKKMVNLRLLKFYGSNGQCRLHLPEGLESLPNQLRLFHWDQYPSKSLPSTFCGENLIELNMKWSRVEELWNGVPDLPNLKSIDLSYSKHLLRLPDFSKASNLKDICLRGCRSLVEIHESIFSLHQLVRLNMDCCGNINKNIKSNIHLKYHRSPTWPNFYGLKEFSLTSGEMDYLYLDLTSIDELSPSYRSLGELRSLSLSNCKIIEHLPNELSELRYLRSLRLSYSKNLDPSKLCVLFDGLRSLESLHLESCHNLYELPDNISSLSLLTDLYLSGSSIKIIPPSFKYLSKLRILELTNSRRLQCITNLPSSIISLYASWCKRLQSISAVLPSIRRLDTGDCKRLKSIMLISTSIGELIVSNNGSLRNISILPVPPPTESIFQLSDNLNLLSRSHDFSQLHARIMSASFKHLSQLKRLDLSNCWWLQCISDLPPSIMDLNVSNCRRLQCLLDLPPAIRLNAMNCRSLEVTGFTSPLFLSPKRISGKLALSFMNCINLDEHAVNSIMECFHSVIKHISCSYVKKDTYKAHAKYIDVCLPGWKVPDWFRHRTRGSSITIPLNLSPDSKFIGFVCCIIVSEFLSNKIYEVLEWECNCYLEARDDRTLKNYYGTIDNYGKYAIELISDHMILWHGYWNYHDEDSITHEANVLLEFKVRIHHGTSNIVIKECGVHPHYAFKYLNSTEELKSEEYLNSDIKPESGESMIEIEVGSSDGNKQQRGMLPPIHINFLPIPSGIPKEGPSGLKELLKF